MSPQVRKLGTTFIVVFGATLLIIFAVTHAGARKDVPPPRPVDVTEAPLASKTVDLKGCPAALVEARKGGTDADRYVVPSEEDRTLMRDMAAMLAAKGTAGRAEATKLAASAGFDVIDVPELTGVVLVREQDAKRRGGGAYLLRLSGPPKTVVQTPHTFFDEGTLPLGCELFQRSSASALFIETAHRYKAADANDSGEHPADVAHSSQSIFQAMTEGVLRVAPKVTIVQLHGFAQRDSGSQVVLSSGDRRGGDPLVARAASRIGPIVGEGVKKFPEDTNELGATKNVQGAAVRASGGRFLHVEMEARLRQNLLKDAALRARYLDALADSVSAP